VGGPSAATTNGTCERAHLGSSRPRERKTASHRRDLGCVRCRAGSGDPESRSAWRRLPVGAVGRRLGRCAAARLRLIVLGRTSRRRARWATLSAVHCPGYDPDRLSLAARPCSASRVRADHVLAWWAERGDCPSDRRRLVQIAESETRCGRRPASSSDACQSARLGRVRLRGLMEAFTAVCDGRRWMPSIPTDGGAR